MKPRYQRFPQMTSTGSLERGYRYGEVFLAIITFSKFRRRSQFYYACPASMKYAGFACLLGRCSPTSYVRPHPPQISVSKHYLKSPVHPRTYSRSPSSTFINSLPPMPFALPKRTPSHSSNPGSRSISSAESQ